MQGDGCVKLTQSAAVGNHSLAVTGGEMILDLNGYTLTGQGIAPITVQGGSLTVIDSVGGGGLVGGAGAPAPVSYTHLDVYKRHGPHQR